MQHNIYHGREYMKALLQDNIRFDVISSSNYPDDYLLEDERCNNRWQPEAFSSLITKCENHYNYKTLFEENLCELLQEKQYDLGIQGGGVGILRDEIIDKFRLGILNFHPGDLPKYRGCSSPEWQIVEGKKVIATCHLVSSGIDSGDIVGKQTLDLDYSDYFCMRASIYPQIAKFVVEIINRIIDKKCIDNLIKQDESIAVYRKYMGTDAIEELKKKMSNNSNYISVLEG